MSFQIRKFDFRAMVAANTGVSEEKLSEVVAAFNQSSDRWETLEKERRAINDSVADVDRGRLTYKEHLSVEQFNETIEYIRDANARKNEIREAQNAEEALMAQYDAEADRMAAILHLRVVRIDDHLTIDY